MTAGRQRHIPVMLDEVMAALGAVDGKRIVDGTYGAGGYTDRIMQAGARVTAFDRDPDAIAAAHDTVQSAGGRLTLHQAPFSTMGDYLAPGSADGVVFDIGVSSMQIDDAGRGFSFGADGPLDMRMGQTGVSAAEIVNTYGLSDLIRIIGILGEEKKASRIARAIVDAREKTPITTTGALAAIIETANPRKAKDRIHPATRAFQGLRIFVNDELRELARALFAAETILKPDGVLAVVTFHSLEDRIVKRFLNDRMNRTGTSRHLPGSAGEPATFEPCGAPLTAVSDAEADANARARSAKLRAAKRTDAAPRGVDHAIFGLARLPWLDVRPTQGDAP